MGKPILTPPTAQRSRTMSAVRSKDTKPELRLRTSLWAAGLRYRVNYKKLPGTPDIVIKKYKLIIFVDGGFWHGFDWEKRKQKIRINREFWIAKIERNMERDIENNEKLGHAGYTIFRFWDFEINKNLGACMKQIIDYVEFKKHHNFNTN